MTVHVDIIKNDLAQLRQVRVAHVFERDGVLTIEGPTDFRTLVLNTQVVDPTSKQRVSPETDPRRFLELLHRELSGSAFFASEAYSSEKSSPFYKDGHRSLAEVDA